MLSLDRDLVKVKLFLKITFNYSKNIIFYINIIFYCNQVEKPTSFQKMYTYCMFGVDLDLERGIKTIFFTILLVS